MWKMWLRVAPWLLIGPISGPLLHGVVYNYRHGRTAMAVCYAIAFLEFGVILPVVAAGRWI